jgi:hypothetical protein
VKKQIFSFITLALFVVNAQSVEIVVKSPDRKVVATVTDAGALSYSVSLDGRDVVRKSRFGIVSDGVDLCANVTLGKSASHTIRETYAMFGGQLNPGK